MDLAARAAAGAQLLDATEPGWAARIDTAALEMQSCAACVLGQLFGEFQAGIVALHRVSPHADMAAYGFTLDEPNILPDWAVLRRAWITQIAARRDLSRFEVFS